MSLLAKLKLKAEGYLLSIGLKRGAAALAGYIVGLLAGPKVSAVLAQMGVTVDPVTLKNSIEGGAAALFVFIHDWWRIKSRPPLAEAPTKSS